MVSFIPDINRLRAINYKDESFFEKNSEINTFAKEILKKLGSDYLLCRTKLGRYYLTYKLKNDLKTVFQEALAIKACDITSSLLEIDKNSDLYEVYKEIRLSQLEGSGYKEDKKEKIIAGNYRSFTLEKEKNSPSQKTPNKKKITQKDEQKIFGYSSLPKQSPASEKPSFDYYPILKNVLKDLGVDLDALNKDVETLGRISLKNMPQFLMLAKFAPVIQCLSEEEIKTEKVLSYFLEFSREFQVFSSSSFGMGLLNLLEEKDGGKTSDEAAFERANYVFHIAKKSKYDPKMAFLFVLAREKIDVEKFSFDSGNNGNIGVTLSRKGAKDYDKLTHFYPFLKELKNNNGLNFPKLSEIKNTKLQEFVTYMEALEERAQPSSNN